MVSPHPCQNKWFITDGLIDFVVIKRYINMDGDKGGLVNVSKLSFNYVGLPQNLTSNNSALCPHNVFVPST
jgi:hypothetical protein